MRIRPNCTVEGCGNPHAAKGMCRKHYYRRRKSGSLELSYREDGEGTITRRGYVMLKMNGVAVFEHVAIAEKALGHPLPPNAEVHHHNEKRSDNRNENLVICPSRAYHMLLHKRTRALDACGNPDWRPCVYCKQHDSLENLEPQGKSFRHPACRRKHQREHPRIKR